MWGLAWSHRAAGRSGRVSHQERSLPGGTGLRPLPDLVQQQALVNLVRYLPLQGGCVAHQPLHLTWQKTRRVRKHALGRCSCLAGGTVLGEGEGGAGQVWAPRCLSACR